MTALPTDVRLDTVNEHGLPIALTATKAGRPLAVWAEEHREKLDALLLEHGAVLLRGFDVSAARGGFAEVARVIIEDLLDYVYRSTPRTSVGKNVYTATEYPRTETIPQHNENAYSRDWPLRLVFHCETPSPEGGETPLSRTPAVTKRISETTKQKFRELGVAYVRTYRDDVDLPWKVVFQTEDRGAVDAFCKAHGIDAEWRSDGTLRTRQRCQATATHPTTREEVWFNQAHLFHLSSHDARTQKALLSMFREDELPRNAYYGDGSPIEQAVLAEVNAAFAAETVTFRWNQGDVLLVDNMLVGHGRKPFKGPRRVLVSMGRPFSASHGGTVFPSLSP